ncbi:alpha/beta hydrolase [Salibacterium aidingense]|uniref:alpha/beta hydrolase n=1 Tax=Salibacterium aidingense TaxID=384933 RepID=UPI003BC25AF6
MRLNGGVNKDKIAVAGFSAGGHLAAALGTMGAIRPNALILGYPCILSGISLAFSIPSVDNEVDDQTPPTFLFTSFEDARVPVKHSLRFMEALHQNNIPFESHIFQSGRHGLSLAKPLTSSGMKQLIDSDFSKWFDLTVSWLHRLFGEFPAE